FPLLAGLINFSQVVDIFLVARTQLHGRVLGLHGGHLSAAGHASHRQQIVGGGEFRIPIEHTAEVLHHVGQALNIGMLRLGDAILQHGKVVANPHVALVERGGVAEFFGGGVELGVLNVVPGQGAVGDLVALGGDERSGIFVVFCVFVFIFIFIFIFVFVFVFVFLVGDLGLRRSGGQRLQLAESGLAALGDSDFHFGSERVGIRFANRLRRDGAVVRLDGRGELVNLRGVGQRIRLLGGVLRDEQGRERMKVIFYRLV